MTRALESIISDLVERRVEQIHVCIPARVQSYDSTKLKISAQPLVRSISYDEQGIRHADPMPVISDVPLVFPGSGGIRIKFPVNVGDIVLLIISSQSLDRWLISGEIVDPEDDRRHSLSDAVAIPGLQPFSGTGAVGNASPMIDITSNEIKAGGSAQLATKADIDALISTFNSHVHGGVTTGAGSSGIPIPTASSSAGTQVLKGS